MPEKSKVELGKGKVPEDIEESVSNRVIDNDEFEAEEAELFPGGPTEGVIDMWKERYGQIFMTEIDDEEIYIWRVLTRAELKTMMEIGDDDPLYKEEVICQKCVLWPTNYAEDTMNGKAGTPSTLADHIFQKSGFNARSGPIPL